MFDLGILLALEAAKPPEMPQVPAMAHERVLLSALGETVMRDGMRRADEFEQEVNAWVARGRALRAEAQGWVPTALATPDVIEKLSGFISRCEQQADEKARTARRLEKRIARDVKRFFREDPSLAAAVRATGARLIVIEKRTVEELLEQALFLRALRTEGLAESRGGQTFDNAEDLSRYLDSIVAA